MSFVSNARRYALLKYRLALAEEEIGLALAWLGKQKRIEGHALPADFPHAAALAKAHYTTREDLVGADEQELMTVAGLSRREAGAVIAALT